MKQIKQVLFGAIATLSVFVAVLYSSCSKDECGAVTCLNKGNCRNGVCQCKDGVYGANCQTVYREIFGGSYKGAAPFDTVNGNNILHIIPMDDSENYKTIEVLWVDSAGAPVVKMPAMLYNITPAGANFFADTARMGNYRYTGTGSVNGNIASMRLVAVHDTGTIVNLSFNNYIRQ